MNRGFSSGRTRLHGFGRIYPVPIPLDPAVHAGATVVGRDPADNKLKLYFSDGVEWGRDIFDTEIVETIERMISDIFLNGFNEADLPDPTLAENLRRYAFNNTRGLPGFVWNNRWNYLADEARVVELAEQVASVAIKVAEPDLLITVGTGGDYPTFEQALEYMAGFVPPVQENIFAGEIRILSGHTLTSQNFLINQNLGWVRITSEDAVVPVNCTGWDKTTPFSTTRLHRPWIYGQGSTLPVIATKFQQIGTVPAEGMCFIRAQTSTLFTYSETAPTPDARTHSYSAGFIGGSIGVIAEGSTASIDRIEISGQTQFGVAAAGSNVSITQSRVRGAKSLLLTAGTQIRISASDYRAVAGTDSATNDLVFDAGGSTGNIIRREGSWGGVPVIDQGNGVLFATGDLTRFGRSIFDSTVPFGPTIITRQHATDAFAQSGLFMGGPVGSGGQGGSSVFHQSMNAGGSQGAFVITQNNDAGGYVRDLARYDYQSQQWQLFVNGSPAITITSARDWLPGADNVTTIGSAVLRPAGIQLVTDPVVTSDETVKKWRGPLTEPEMRVAKQLVAEFGIYQFLDSIAEKGDAARLHYGPRAQRVFALFDKEGLDWRRYAWCCRDKWDTIPAQPAVEEVRDEDGKIIVPGRNEIPEIPAGERYGVRSDQLAYWVIAAIAAVQSEQGAEIEALRAAITAFEQRIAALEGKRK